MDFNKLKDMLTTTPIIISSDWSLFFKLMWNVSDYIVGAILGKNDWKKDQIILC